MKAAFVFVMALVGLAAAADSAGTGPDLEARFCPVGKACKTDRECGSCSCNDWKGTCQQ